MCKRKSNFVNEARSMVKKRIIENLVRNVAAVDLMKILWTTVLIFLKLKWHSYEIQIPL